MSQERLETPKAVVSISRPSTIKEHLTKLIETRLAGEADPLRRNDRSASGMTISPGYPGWESATKFTDVGKYLLCLEPA